MPFRPHSKGVTAEVRLTPGARKEGIFGIADAGDGKQALKISVRAVPEDGRANKALLSLLADEWNLPKSALSLLSGAASRRKTVLVEGDSKSLMAELLAWRNKQG
jgi:uncharacterized protein (TIGR00251 family)